MHLDVFVAFNGNCREAVEFYSAVFKKPVENLMTFGDMPHDPSFPVSDEAKNLICYCSLAMDNGVPMFCDSYPGMEVTVGDNVTLTLSSKDKADIENWFNAMADGGVVGMPLQETFWSDLYGMVVDKYGVSWQFSHDSGKGF